jgi:hypothetical protein
MAEGIFLCGRAFSHRPTIYFKDWVVAEAELASWCCRKRTRALAAEGAL